MMIVVAGCIFSFGKRGREKGRGILTLVFSPFPIAGSFIVYPGEEVEFLERHLLGLDA